MELHVAVFLFAIEGGVQILARSLSGLLFDQKTLKKVRGIIWCADILGSGTVVCLFAAITSFTGMAVLMGLRGLVLAIYISHQTLMTCDMCGKSKESGLLPHAIGMTQLSKGIGILLGSLISGRSFAISIYQNHKRIVSVCNITPGNASLVLVLTFCSRGYLTLK